MTVKTKHRLSRNVYAISDRIWCNKRLRQTTTEKYDNDGKVDTSDLMMMIITWAMDDVIKWKHFAGPLWGESTGHRWLPLTKASDAELWYFLWSAPEQTIKKCRRWWFETQSRLLWRHCNVNWHLMCEFGIMERSFPPIDRLYLCFYIWQKNCALFSHTNIFIQSSLYCHILET